MTSLNFFEQDSAPEQFDLREYQHRCLDDLALGIQQGHRRQILCSPTGSGKTVIAAHLIDLARQKKSRVVFATEFISLVDQASETLRRYGIPHGIAQGENTRNRGERIQVVSLPTIEKRGFWPDIDLLIIDEAHRQRKSVLEFATQWGGPTIGLSATPMTQGLGIYYTRVVNAVTTDDLLRDGWLASLKVFTPEMQIDMSGAPTTGAGGEWAASEVGKRVKPIIGNVVSEWVRLTHEHFGGPVKTLLFSADVADGEEICAAFQRAGYDFRQSSYHDSTEDTQRMVRQFRNGEFTGLVSVEKFVLGFDVPDVKCIVGGRPYRKSLASFIQQLGRGMRIADGKDYCLYIDTAGNMAGWYEDVLDFWAMGVNVLNKDAKQMAKKTRREKDEQPEVVCLSCGYVLMPAMRSCPSCGIERQRRSKIVKAHADMRELVQPGSREWMQAREWTWAEMCKVALGWKGGDVQRAKSLALAQYKNLYGDFPPREWGFIESEGGDARVERRMRKQIAEWRRSTPIGRYSE